MVNAGKVVRKLTTMESFNLINLMKDPDHGYAIKAVTDSEYAQFATQKLGMSVTPGNIAGARDALMLPATKNVHSQAAKTAAVEVLDFLEDIDDKLNRIIRYLSEQAKRDI